MKKLLLSSLLAGLLASLASGETMYSTLVKPVSLTSNLNEVAGKLLPTNAVNIVGKEGGALKFEITGYQNPSAPNVIYFTPKARVIAISFAKTKMPQVQVIGQEGGFNVVKLAAYTSEGGFAADLDAIFASAKQKFEESCSVCHELPKAAEYPANRWPALIKSMQNRTPMSADESWAVTQYLQKHSKDVNVKETK